MKLSETERLKEIADEGYPFPLDVIPPDLIPGRAPRITLLDPRSMA